MELRHLRYFVTLAEELSFTRAAKRLHMSQPPLSLQIRQLEKELGTSLVRRQTRGLELTDAGKLLLEQGRAILKQVEDAAVGVRRRARGETGRILVGSTGFYCHPLITKCLSEIKERYPNLTIAPELDVTNTPLLIAWLRTGRVDVGIVSTPVDDSEGLQLEQLVNEDCVIALPPAHPLANSASAPIAKLAKEKLVLCYRAATPGMHDSILAACRRAGFNPQISQQVPQIVSVMPVVAAGFGLSIIPRSFSEIRFPGLTYVNIEGDPPRAGIAIACRRDERSAAIKNVMKVARLTKIDRSAPPGADL